ncbi:class I SAM-dependent methyltransferase [Egibacter rhizosphaerae]|uniref:Class I SAM-dependent methyltransferase n=1 Tax=Egibacter rhizosphaerae TaxID=1670831 RepID=A0A411YJM9_9ACTN|nr:class I SAM-dependent methyltransferase [Egibacter rhizosphaerae]QBI21366.1 class I SAM-dependent methyltransferase [Egibacter rhizosphaerae]
MAGKTITSDLYQDEYEPSFVDKWDELIDWEGRAKGEGDFYPRILRDAGCTRVLDAATGTGYHAVQLAKAGFDVLAADGAAEMVSKTAENAARLGVDLPVQEADWRTLADDVPGEFDALLCLGNAFTHLFTEDERVRALEQFHKVLRPGGLVIIDQRNYDSILDEGFNTKHQYYYTGKGVDARPEEISDEAVRFRYQFPDGGVHHLTMYPLRQDYLTGLLADAGFRNIRRFGDFKEAYQHHEPDFVVQVGTA